MEPITKEDFSAFEKTIKKKHRIAWSPKYNESFSLPVKKILFMPLAIQTFEKLGWEVYYTDEETVEANRKNSWNTSTEAIIVKYFTDRIEVKSKSLGNEFWDNGRNSKRVKLFIHAFEKTYRSLDRSELDKIEAETKRMVDMEDYIVPETLPAPFKKRQPTILFPLLGGLLIAVILGYLVAFFSFHGKYLIGLYEVAVGLALGYSIGKLAGLGNYIHYKKLQTIVIVSVLLTYLLNEYFLYTLIFKSQAILSGFPDFLAWRLEQGLTIDKMSLGWIGRALGWALQLVLSYVLAIYLVSNSNAVNAMKNVPDEVLDFVLYQMNKDKPEELIRQELSKKGWTESKDQDDAINAAMAVYAIKFSSKSE